MPVSPFLAFKVSTGSGLGLNHVPPLRSFVAETQHFCALQPPPLSNRGTDFLYVIRLS